MIKYTYLIAGALFISLSFWFDTAYSQPINNIIDNVIKPSPEAASLGKFGDIPVDPSRGVPNIGIPIHVLQEGPLQLPVTLNYHASGIRVEEISAWVGTGWNLSAGGMISRVVQGIADDDNNGYYHTGNQFDFTDPQHVNEAANGIRDSEPDIFSYNFPGYSGKFFFDKNGNANFIPKNDLQIEIVPNGTLFDGFIITTPDGTKYYFGYVSPTDRDYRERTIGMAEESDNFISAWYLARMESYDGNYFIDFNYADAAYIYEQSSKCRIFYHQGTSSGCSPDEVQTNCYTGARIQIDIEGKKLTSIVTSTDQMTFQSSTNRLDVEAGVRLDAIIIDNGLHCKQIAFSYSYFVDNQTSDGDKRLKLDQIQESSCSGETLPPYVFDYYGPVYNGDKFFINRYSKQVDHWGYYNGATANTNIPNIPLTTLPYLQGEITKGSATTDRNSHYDFMVQATLKSITYPTGGESIFEFEANSHEDWVAGNEYTVFTFDSNCNPDGSDCCGSNTTQDYFYTFSSVEEIENGTFELYLEPAASCLEGGEIGLIVVNIYDFNASTQTWELATSLEVDGDLSQPSYNIRSSIINSPFSFQPNVNYKFVMEYDEGFGKFSIKTRDLTLQDVEVGGLRIKRITHKNGLNDKDIIKEYKYHVAGNENKSSGVLLKEPKYGYNTQGKVLSDACTIGDFSYAVFSEQSIVSLYSFEGYHIAYERVAETMPNNGQTVYTFDINFQGISNSYPTKPDYFQIEAGKLLHSKSIRESDGATVSETFITPKDNMYDYSETIYKIMTLKAESCGTQFCSYTYFLGTTDYEIRTGIYQVETREVITDEVSQSVAYEYNTSDFHYQPVKETFTNSNNKVNVKETKFAYEMRDIDAGNGIWQEMIDRNMVGIPVQQTLEVSNELVSGSKTVYGAFTPSGAHTTTVSGNTPRPYEFLNYEMTWQGNTPIISGSDGWILQGRIDAYHGDNDADQKAYPKQFTQVGWNPEFYTWANGQITSRKYCGEYDAGQSDCSGDDFFEWEYEYFPGTQLLKKMTDVDDQFIEYDYDQFRRLTSISSRNGNVTTTFDYIFDNTTSQNAVQAHTAYMNDPQSSSQFDNRTIWQYFDGLGRLVQTVDQGHSENGNDVVVAMEYDEHGREWKSYEPFEASAQTGAFAVVPGNTPFTQKTYYDSPLNRLKSVVMPNWNYPTLYAYGNNSGAININGETYPVGSLSTTTITDANGNMTISATDIKGRMIQSQRVNGNNTSEKAETTYAYDGKDRVSMVVPPDAMESDEGLIYQYSYDGADNILSKQIPGQANPILHLYDERDLLTYMQDPMMQNQGRWLHTQYDSYGRPVATGFVNQTPTSGEQIATFDAALTRTCYDGCDFAGTPPVIYKGKVHRTENRIIGTHDWLQTLNYYDNFGRVEKTVSNYHLDISKYDSEVSIYSYDFADNILRMDRTHQLDGEVTTITEETTYDHAGRPVETYHQLNSDPRIQISMLQYTAKDQISTKYLGKVGASWLQKVDFDYLDNGFIKSINQPTLGGTVSVTDLCDPTIPNPGNTGENDLFYLQLNYDQLDFGAGGWPHSEAMMLPLGDGCR